MAAILSRPQFVKTWNLCTITSIKWFLILTHCCNIVRNPSLHIPLKPVWLSKIAIYRLNYETLGAKSHWQPLIYNITFFWVGVIHPNLKSIKPKTSCCSEIIEDLFLFTWIRGHWIVCYVFEIPTPQMMLSIYWCKYVLSPQTDFFIESILRIENYK